MKLKSIFAVIVCAGALTGFAQAQPPEPLAPEPVEPQPGAPAPGQRFTAREAADFYFSVGHRLDAAKILELHSPAEKEVFLKEYGNKLDWLRLALQHRFKRPAGLTAAIMLPHYTNFRAVARLLALEGQVRESKGDISGAVSSYLDAVQFGSEIQRDGW